MLSRSALALALAGLALIGSGVRSGRLADPEPPPVTGGAVTMIDADGGRFDAGADTLVPGGSFDRHSLSRSVPNALPGKRGIIHFRVRNAAVQA